LDYNAVFIVLEKRLSQDLVVFYTFGLSALVVLLRENKKKTLICQILINPP
jgi:hypothetical protein